MRRILAAVALFVGLLASSHDAAAQVYVALNAVSADTTGAAIDTGGSSGVVVQISSASTSSAVVTVQQSLHGSTWTSRATCTNPGSTAAASCLIPLGSAPYTRLVVSSWVSGVITGRVAVNRTGRNPTMVGATASVPGVGGTVPPAQAGDQAKVLSGAGTWIANGGGGGSGDITGVTLTGTAPVSVSGSPCTTADCAFTFALTGVTLDANGWTQSVPVTGGDADKGYVWNVATSGGYPDFGMSLVLGGLTLTGDDQEFHARKQITVHANASGGGLDGFCFEKAAAEACMVYDFTGNVLQLPTVALANPLAVADGGTGVASFGQNTVLAGPTSGGAGTATARALVAGDLPTVPVSSGGTGGTDASTARTNLGLVIGTDVAAAAHGVTTGAIPYASSSTAFSALSLLRIDGNTLEMRNGTSGQEFRVSNSYTDASNYERTYFGRNLSTTVSRIGTESLGTGVARQIRFAINGTDYATVSTSGLSVVGTVAATAIAGTTSDSVPLGSASTLFNHLYLTRSIQGGISKALTESTATSFVRVAIPSGSSRGVRVDYLVRADDGTDFQSLEGDVWVSGSNKAGTISVGTIAERQSTCACSTGTLTATVTVVDAGSGNMDVKINATSSLAQTTLAAVGSARAPLTATISWP